MSRRILTYLAATLLAWPLSTPAEPVSSHGVADASASELRTILLAQDQALFAAIFDDRDADKLRSLLADDLEFYHDKWGQTARSADAFVESVRGMFKRQDEGTDFRGRRALDVATVQIHPLAGYGAMMMGTHRFWNRQTGQPTEVARFIHLWKLADGHWQLTRAISYDHQPWQE